MTSLAKKMLSAFVEVTGQEKLVPIKQPTCETSAITEANSPTVEKGSSRFVQYFDKLFSEVNMSGPDYYAFSKMIEVMQFIPDEKARFCGAFAGLSVQGLDKEKLLSTAAAYLKLLEEDAANFNVTIDAALQEKVFSKQKEIAEKKARIQELSGEIADLHNQISLLEAGMKENEEKIEASTNGYKTEGQNIKSRILLHIEKINEHISKNY